MTLILEAPELVRWQTLVAEPLAESLQLVALCKFQSPQYVLLAIIDRYFQVSWSVALSFRHAA